MSYQETAMNLETEQYIKDTEHLKILSIVYYITGVVTLFKSAVFLIHVFLGIIFIIIASSSGEDELAIPGFIFLAIGCIGFLLGILIGILKLVTGYMLGKRKMRMFCLIVGVLSCLSIPYGTTQGVFTIIVLVRQSVVNLFTPEQNKGTAG